MFTPPRHHSPSKWANRRGQVRVAVRMTTRILDEENRRLEWREACWQRHQQRGWAPRRESRLDYPPPRPFQGTPRPRRWPPDFGRDQRWGENPNHFPQRQPPRDWRSRMLPRRGPPVAAIRVPRWPRQELCGRQPRGVKPRGPLRGGPERSAKDPQLPHKNITKSKAKDGRTGKQEAKKRPAIITVGKNGEERNWGPLSRSNAWRAGSYWEEMDGEALVFLEKDSVRRDVEVEKMINGHNEWFWFREKRTNSPTRNSEGVMTTQFRKTGMACKKTLWRRGGPNNWTR